MKISETRNHTIYGIYEKDSNACLYIGETSLKLSRRLTLHEIGRASCRERV